MRKRTLVATRVVTGLAVVFSLILSLLLSACSTTGSSSTQGNGSEPTRPTSVAASSTPAAASPSQGTSAKGTPIKIGLLAEKTGGLAAYGYAHEKVATAVVKKINAEGGIGGRPVELFVEDTESQPGTGSLKMRKLIETNGVDFVIGSNSSGIVLAAAPIAKELKTVYFPTAGGALLTTPGKGNRYVFELNTNVGQETIGAAKFATEKLGKKKWVTFVVDYAWGWDNEQSFKKALEGLGGTVESAARVPLGTSDWLRYLKGKIPDDAEGIYFANFGTDFLSFIRDLNVVRPNITKFGSNYVISGQDIKQLGPAAEGLYVLTGYPRRADAKNTPYDKAYRQAIGMDDEGREVGSGKYLVPSYQWSTWEAVYTIKEIVEESGWKSKKDNPAFIKTLEGKSFKEGYAHPEGDKRIRAEDHLSLKSLYIEQIKDGNLPVVKKISPEEMAYPPVINYPKDEPLD